MLKDVEVDLNLADLEIPKDFSILQCPNIWNAKTSAPNDGTAHKKDTENLRKGDSSS